MSLTVATLVLGFALLLKGGWFIAGPRLGGPSIALLRSKPLAGILLGVLSAWFLYKVMHLGESDFGNYRNVLFAIFLATAIGAWFYTPDFLAVRAGSGLFLMLAGLFLQAGFGQYEFPQRLFMVGAVYLGIIGALYYAAVPYRMRDTLNWLYAQPARPHILGTAMASYGVLLVVVSATY